MTLSEQERGVHGSVGGASAVERCGADRLHTVGKRGTESALWLCPQHGVVRVAVVWCGGRVALQRRSTASCGMGLIAVAEQTLVAKVERTSVGHATLFARTNTCPAGVTTAGQCLASRSWAALCTWRECSLVWNRWQ